MRIKALTATGIAALLCACSAGTPAAEGAAAPATETASATSAPETPAPPAAEAPAIPPLPADPLAVGSQEAKDDMYCSALIYAENPDVSDALAPVDEAVLRKAQTLGFVIGEAGINKLVAEKAIHATHARALSDAYSDQVVKDMKAKKLRISLDACNKRAAAVPVPE
ncbi:MAG: hypothetical protein QM773_03550 [Hyphomonadaceae bacterium]